MAVTGKDLIAMGYVEGPWFGPALAQANARALAGAELRAFLDTRAPVPVEVLPMHDAAPGLQVNITAETPAEAANVEAVLASMAKLMRTPTVVGGAVMPDACPAGPPGTIPVGGVVAARNAIHPGMHSADICCSVMLTEFADAEPLDVLNAVHSVTHFGPGGRPDGARFGVGSDLMDAFRANPFLNTEKILKSAEGHLGTQGDGNHFAFVGRSRATGNTCLVTHHGSRGPGAGLYKCGMQAAETYRRDRSPEVLKQNAWLDADSDEGVAYWEALQLVRAWTKTNHEVLHEAAAVAASAAMSDRFWNEHNFVFRDGDIYYHAKGATPIHDAYLPDSDGRQIVPLNMAEPVLIVKGSRNDRNLGFAPHGAGRNYSRTAHKRSLEGRSDEDVFAEETAHIDARFFCGRIDVSELPSAYKNADTVRAQMSDYGLADVVDEIEPFGSIMAGDWEFDAPWRRKARAKRAAPS